MSSANAGSLTVIILTKNEAQHILRAIQSVLADGLASEVIVVDSYSTDETVALAQAAGALVVQNPFINQAVQFQWALDNAPTTASWILRLDADEIIEPDLRATLIGTLGLLPPEVTGVNLQRKHIFLGRWIRHGGRYPLEMMRIWRRGLGRVENRWMDEHIVVDSGQIITIKGGFADHNLNDLPYFVDKHNKYATREAVDVLSARLGLAEATDLVSTTGGFRQASLKRFIKVKIYNRIPFQISSTLYFLFRYVLQFGFLDGKQGLIYHFLQGFWYRFLVGARIYELEQALTGVKGKEEIVLRLSTLTGLSLHVPRNTITATSSKE